MLQKHRMKKIEVKPSQEKSFNLRC